MYFFSRLFDSSLSVSSLKEVSIENHIRKMMKKIVFLEKKGKLKRKLSGDEPPLNVFSKSPAHDGRKLSEICYFAITISYW